MGLLDDAETSKLPSGDPRLGQTTGPISSLNEAWFHTLDRCVTGAPERGHSSPDTELLFWRRDARDSLAAEGSWRSDRFRYCSFQDDRAAVLRIPSGVEPEKEF